jgi:demethylmenaquinone methyltransferase/2-methoxy-6-polyprenyl-1,4-benzoquinol methylase
VREYYDRRAPEYDETAYGAADDEQSQELERLQAAVASLPSARTLDVACGTGYFTRYLQGEVAGLDQSEGMLRIARGRLPMTPLLRGESRVLPFRDASFDRVFTSLFYGHLEEADRRQFLMEARRVARQLVVVEEAFRDGLAPEGWEDRPLADGTQHFVYKRYFRPRELAEELGGAEVILAGKYFLMVTSGSLTESG